MVETNQTKCDLAFQLTYHPVYRFAQFWTFSVSALAIPAVAYFLIKRIFVLHFHKNLKTILIAFFISIFLFACACSFSFGYHFLIPFFVNSSCDLIIENPLFKYVHVLVLFLMTVPMLLSVGFSVERIVAMALAHKYEHIRTFLGPLLVVFLIAIDVIINFKVYQNETFEDNFISFILIPNTSAAQWNSFFWLLLYIDIGNFLCNCALLISHTRLKNRHLRRRSTLSVKYEMQEIYVSSTFTLVVSFTHLLFVGWYLVSTLFIRTLGQSFFNGYINYTVARGSCCVIPTYNLIIVFIGWKMLNLLESKRISKVQSTIEIKSTGAEGVKNYEEAIWKHWDTVSSGLSKV